MDFGFIVFILTALLFILLSVFTFTATSKHENRFFHNHIRQTFYAAFGCEAILIILTILDLSGAAELGGYSGLTAWCAGSGAVILFITAIRKKLPQKFGDILNFFLRSLTVCLIAELFVFNFNSAHLFGGNYQVMELPAENASAVNFSNGKNSGTGYSSLEFKNINMPVGTITVEARSDKKSYAEINVDMSDDSNASYRNSAASAEVIQNNRRSETIPCNFSGNVHNLKFSFIAEEGETVTISRIVLNLPIFLDFSALRFLIMLTACMAVYMMTASPVFKKSFGENRVVNKICAYALTGVFILAALFLTNVYRYSDSNHSLKKDFSQESGNQMTQELVDAFEAGQVSLLREAEQPLLELENPYDWSRRLESGVDYAWDHLLYDGKYYSYYGIAPVITLFLPYHLITDHYFPSVWAVWLYGAVGILFLSKFYLAFISKFFPKIRSSLALAGLFMLQLVTGVWFCFSNPNFYEIAQTSGFACVAAGAFFLISSNVIGGGKIKNWRLALSAVFLSLGVLCRPTLAVYCVASLIFIYVGFRKKRSCYTKSKSMIRHYLPYFLCSLLPFAVIGGAQMIYNYARFGSVFDFGIQYSLTINDFTAAQYHTHFVLIGFFNYLLAVPSFIPVFPFLDSSRVETFFPQGYYFVATASAVGLIWKALPVLSYGYGIRAYRYTENKNKRLYALMIFAVCIAAPFIIIFSIWESGYGTRYCVDFAWQILIGALAIAFIMYGRCSQTLKRHLNRLMLLSAGICLVLSFGQVYNWISEGGMSVQWKAMITSFGRLFEFWR